MFTAIASLVLAASAPSHFQSTPTGRMDLGQIKECNNVEHEFNVWTLDMYEKMYRHTSNYGGKIDQSLIEDYKIWAMPEIKSTVHERIQQEQRIRFNVNYDRGPNSANCRLITQIARDRTKDYLRELLNGVHPSDRAGRRALFESFRVELRQSTREPFAD